MPCKCNETVGNAANVTYREFTPWAGSVFGDGFSLSPSSRQGQSDISNMSPVALYGSLPLKASRLHKMGRIRWYREALLSPCFVGVSFFVF